MTRPRKKQDESEALSELLSATRVELESQPLESETPDFVIRMSGRTIGVEITMYRSGQALAGIPKRAIEAAWEEFETTSQIFRREHPELASIYILFRFKDAIPPRQEHDRFVCEVLECVRCMGYRTGNGCVSLWRGEITSPLMRKYLKDIVLRRCERSEWDSNITAGFVVAPAGIISRIIVEKSEKQYRLTDELWLVVQRSQRPSETILAINGVSEFNASPDLQEILAASPFSRVYIFTAMGLFQWDRTAVNGCARWTKCFFPDSYISTSLSPDRSPSSQEVRQRQILD